MRWTVVIPAKASPAAKSRLADAVADADGLAVLAAALRADTIAAVLATPDVAHVVVVSDAPADVPNGVELLVQSQPGLNAAIAEAATHAGRTWPDHGIAALLGDLPALTPAELEASLTSAALVAHGFVADAAGTGTTLLTAAPGLALEPRFGVDSAAAHAAIADTLPAGPGLRQDVDTLDDLRAALELGVGPATLAASTSVVHLSGR